MKSVQPYSNQGHLNYVSQKLQHLLHSYGFKAFVHNPLSGACVQILTKNNSVETRASAH